MVVGTPRFGPKLDPDEHMSHMANFEAEMYEFADDRRERDRYVNMLHLGTDLGTARPEMDRIVRSMGKWGYGVEHKTGVGLSNSGEMLLAGIDTDMLILGSDTTRYASARYMLWCVSVGWFGIVPYWDVLLYGTDYTPNWLEPRVGLNPPMCSNRKFALDGACLAHAHIRRRHDRSALSGAYIEMMREIEGRINGLVKEAWKIRTTYERFEAFKTKVADDGHRGLDINLFFAALDVLRHSRNVGAHLVRGLPQEVIEKKQEQRNESFAKFDMLAKGYGRPLWPPTTSSKADSHFADKWESSLAHMAVAWLEEYSGLSASP